MDMTRPGGRLHSTTRTQKRRSQRMAWRQRAIAILHPPLRATPPGLEKQYEDAQDASTKIDVATIATELDIWWANKQQQINDINQRYKTILLLLRDTQTALHHETQPPESAEEPNDQPREQAAEEIKHPADHIYDIVNEHPGITLKQLLHMANLPHKHTREILLSLKRLDIIKWEFGQFYICKHIE